MRFNRSLGIAILTTLALSVGACGGVGLEKAPSKEVVAEAPATTMAEAPATTVAEAPTTTKAPATTTTTRATTTTQAPTTTTAEFTRSEQNAIGSAEDYLSFTAFSRSGLIGQLEYEGFTNAEATLAVDYLHVDWNEQAWKSAEQYLEFSSFSRSGLIDQLEYEGFTTEQATYGVDQTGL